MPSRNSLSLSAFLTLCLVACGSGEHTRASGQNKSAARSQAQQSTPRSTSAWAGYRLERSLGRSGDGPGELRTPMGLDVNARGEIAVADAGNARVEVLSAQGARVWTYAGEGDNVLGRPMDVAFTPDGSLWVVDFERDALVHLDAQGQFIERRSGDEAPKSPAGVLVLPDGRLVVSSFYDHALWVYGDHAARKLGAEGDGVGQFHYPTGLARDDAGRLWVADSYNHRVQRFGASLEPETSLRGDRQDPLEVPVGVAWLGGVLHVADSAHHRVVGLDPETGRVLAEWRVPGGPEVHTPSRVVAKRDRLYVADPAGDQIYVLRRSE